VNFPVGSEGPEREWKEVLPRKDRIANTLCAFANGEGGTLLVGVRDDGQVVGLANPEFVKADLERVAAGLEPPQTIKASIRKVEGCVLLEVRVAPSSEPVSVTGPDGELCVYVRDGSSSRLASKAEARALARVSGGRTRIDSTARRLLEEISRSRTPTLATIARAVRLGERAARRRLVPLIQAGLVLEKADRRLWLTPHGHRRLRRE